MMSPMTRQPLDIEFSLLGFLRQGPQHGYQIHQQIIDPAGVGRVWRIKQARLYALLGRLEAEGYIQGALQPQRDRPARRVFSLTHAGEQAFLAWLDSPVESPRHMRQLFQVKLYFARQEGQGICARLVAKQRAACQVWLENLQALADSQGDASSYAWLVTQYRIGQVQAMLGWLDCCSAGFT
jgi:PadR family transcriptional regulator AphA